MMSDGRRDGIGVGAKGSMVIGTVKLTRERILAMPAGRELDALVAEKVMAREPQQCEKHKSEPDGHACGLCWGWDQFPNYSTDIAAAWQVVEKMKEDGDVFIEWWQDDEWFVSPKPLTIRKRDGTREGAAAPIVSHAICRAALLAVVEKL